MAQNGTEVLETSKSRACGLDETLLQLQGRTPSAVVTKQTEHISWPEKVPERTSAPLPLNTSECCLYAYDGYMKHIEILVRLICHSTVIVLSQYCHRLKINKITAGPWSSRSNSSLGGVIVIPFCRRHGCPIPSSWGATKIRPQRLAETPILHCQILIALFLRVSVRMPSQNEIVYRKVESINLIIFLIYILLNLYIII